MKRKILVGISFCFCLMVLALQAKAVTVNPQYFNSIGMFREVMGTIALDSSYPTGGESITAANLGMSNVLAFAVTGDTYGHDMYYDLGTNKLRVYETGGRAGKANTTVTVDTYGEVNNTQNLSGVTGVQFRAVGY